MKKKLLETVFSMRSDPRLFNDDMYRVILKGEAYSQDKPILLSEKMLHKYYDSKGSVAKKKNL
jgi:hypothetical protein